MARLVHLLGEGGKSGCCGKTAATLGLGAILTDDVEAVTCPAMLRFEPKPEHVHSYDGECAKTKCPQHGKPYRVILTPVFPEPQKVEVLKEREGDQPLPVARPDVLDVQSQVIADIVERREVGIKRYGTPLQPHNGRDALRDLYEELLDGAMYAKQLMLERSTLLGRIAELEAQIALMRRES